MSSTLKRKQLTLKTKSTKSASGFSIFDQIQIQEFKEAFNIIDQDKDGFICEKDLSLMFTTIGKIESQAIVKEMLNECSGPLNFHSFLSLFAEKIGSSDPESVVINAYSMFDPADTGKVNCDTLKDMLKSMGERYTDEETLDFFENVPLEENGKEMNYKEFSKILKNGERDKNGRV